MPEPSDKDHPKYKLYVIFHGSWAFVDNVKKPEKYIHARAADLANHVFMAGSWMGEIKIVRHSQLCLEIDEQPRQARLWEDGKKKMVLFEPLEKQGCKAYADIHFPRPARIHPELLVGPVNIHDNQTAAPCEMYSSQMCLVPVFEYEFVNPPYLRFGGIANEEAAIHEEIFWKPSPLTRMRVITLHMFAADDNGSRQDQPGDFEEVGRLLAYNIKFNGPNPKLVGPRHINIPDLEGREFEVTTFLHERVDHLRAIGAQMQYRGSHSLYSWDPPLPSPIVEDDARKRGRPYLDYGSCGSGGGGS